MIGALNANAQCSSKKSDYEPFWWNMLWLYGDSHARCNKAIQIELSHAAGKRLQLLYRLGRVVFAWLISFKQLGTQNVLFFEWCSFSRKVMVFVHTLQHGLFFCFFFFGLLLLKWLWTIVHNIKLTYFNCPYGFVGAQMCLGSLWIKTNKITMRCPQQFGRVLPLFIRVPVQMCCELIAMLLHADGLWK